MNKLKRLKFLYLSLGLYREKIFRVIFFEIYYSIKYFTSGNFIKPPDLYPCPYYFIHKISQFINMKKISRVVDLGCGSGRITNFLNDTTKAKIYGYEIDEEAFNLANKNKGTNVTIKFGNIFGHLFLDVGAAWDNSEEFNDSALVRSKYNLTDPDASPIISTLGIGMKIFTPWALIRIDTAWDRYPDGDYSKPQYILSIGYDW